MDEAKDADHGPEPGLPDLHALPVQDTLSSDNPVLARAIQRLVDEVADEEVISAFSSGPPDVDTDLT